MTVPNMMSKTFSYEDLGSGRRAIRVPLSGHDQTKIRRGIVSVQLFKSFSIYSIC